MTGRCRRREPTRSSPASRVSIRCTGHSRRSVVRVRTVTPIAGTIVIWPAPYCRIRISQPMGERRRVVRRDVQVHRRAFVHLDHLVGVRDEKRVIVGLGVDVTGVRGADIVQRPERDIVRVLQNQLVGAVEKDSGLAVAVENNRVRVRRVGQRVRVAGLIRCRSSVIGVEFSTREREARSSEGSELAS